MLQTPQDYFLPSDLWGQSKRGSTDIWDLLSAAARLPWSTAVTPNNSRPSTILPSYCKSRDKALPFPVTCTRHRIFFVTAASEILMDPRPGCKQLIYPQGLPLDLTHFPPEQSELLASPKPEVHMYWSKTLRLLSRPNHNSCDTYRQDRKTIFTSWLDLVKWNISMNWKRIIVPLLLIKKLIYFYFNTCMHLLQSNRNSKRHFCYLFGCLLVSERLPGYILLIYYVQVLEWLCLQPVSFHGAQYSSKRVMVSQDMTHEHLKHLQGNSHSFPLPALLWLNWNKPNIFHLMFKFKSPEHLTHLKENVTNCIIAEHVMMETLA